MVQRTWMEAVAVACCILVPAVASASGPLDPRDPSLARPALDPRADAEVVRWELRAVDAVVAQGFERRIELSRSTMVYTRKGAEAEGTSSLTIPEDMVVENQVITVTTPDGRRRVIRPEESFERDLLRLEGRRVRTRRFAIPGVVPGTLVELDVRVRLEDRGHLMPFWFPIQEDIPIRSLELSVRPWVDSEFRLRTNRALGVPIPVRTDDKGAQRITVREVPGYLKEPYMRPEFESRLAVLGTYGRPPGAISFDPSLLPGGWPAYLGVTDTLRQIATTITGAATSAEARLERLHSFCRDSIENIALREPAVASAILEERIWDRLRARHRMDPLRTLRTRMGTPHDVSLLLAALACASGLDAKVVMLVEPVMAAFDSGLVFPEYSDRSAVAIASAGGWRFTCPADRDLKPGWLSAADEGTDAILFGAGPLRLVRAPAHAASESRTEREAELTIDEDGNAAGDLIVMFQGHSAVDFRRMVRARGPEEVEKDIRAMVSSAYAGVEIRAFHLFAFETTNAPVGWGCTLHLPSYARGGDGAWILPLDPLQALDSPDFTSPFRTQQIDWPYSRTEVDSVSIRLPEKHTCVLSRGPSDVSELGVLQAHSEGIWEREENVVRFRWHRQVGTRGRLRLSPEHYESVRTAFARSRDLALATAQVIRPIEPGAR